MDSKVEQAIASYGEKALARQRFENDVMEALQNVSQRQLAQALGVSQPYVAQIVKRQRSAYESNPYMTLRSLSDTLRTVLRENHSDQNFMVRMVAQSMTDFRQLRSVGDRERFMEQPDSTGSDKWDAMLASVAERESRRAHIDIPDWVYDPRFILSPWWFLSPTEGLKAYSLQHAAPEFAIRNVYIDADSLESV